MIPKPARASCDIQSRVFWRDRLLTLVGYTADTSTMTHVSVNHYRMVRPPLSGRGHVRRMRNGSFLIIFMYWAVREKRFIPHFAPLRPQPSTASLFLGFMRRRRDLAKSIAAALPTPSTHRAVGRSGSSTSAAILLRPVQPKRCLPHPKSLSS